ncbi:nitrate reductase cytochrome c-type subunit [Rhizobacter sp. SG703]|uniref:nitrate reductase cytochrome c-type subunit n=1 Tax=Rhizobacter sp. SG703 TaxID=2587140 RepID=UPI00144746D4|nr:nitrate reductase cytochrome c-type subunit [Rhizobacter sp. SG703]NKI94193.1 cytochrome c-type protein NapB [Rhizobacter sp. SG703]
MNALRLLARSCALACALACAAAAAAPPLLQDAMRGPTPILDNAVPPRLANAVNDDQRRTRNYDMQPPIVPHRVDGYQVDRNFNKCLDCHARARTGFSQAVPVSVTHYIDRSGKVLAQISTRRYFCQQCHVAQEPVRPLVANTFEDVDTVLRKAAAAPQR